MDVEKNRLVSGILLFMLGLYLFTNKNFDFNTGLLSAPTYNKISFYILLSLSAVIIVGGFLALRNMMTGRD
ncbi:MAG: hypothetical protein HWN66_19535, partial [Candidatus Helarchaeota archaeon]|nr:hypothetical protein [Candidatus Helarchaeota archaeon]